MAIKIHCFLRQRSEYRVLVNEFQYLIDFRPRNEEEKKYVFCAHWKHSNPVVCDNNLQYILDFFRKPWNYHRVFLKLSIFLLTVPSAFGQWCRFTIISMAFRCHCRFLHGEQTRLNSVCCLVKGIFFFIFQVSLRRHLSVFIFDCVCLPNDRCIYHREYDGRFVFFRIYLFRIFERMHSNTIVTIDSNWKRVTWILQAIWKYCALGEIPFVGETVRSILHKNIII